MLELIFILPKNSYIHDSKVSPYDSIHISEMIVHSHNGVKGVGFISIMNRKNVFEIRCKIRR